MATYASKSNPFIDQSTSPTPQEFTDANSETNSNEEKITQTAEPEEEVDIDDSPRYDDRNNQHIELIKKLRLQLKDLERYAYERGELDKRESIPDSVLAERQNLVIQALTDKLSLNIGTSEIEKLGLDDLKKQVDKEIQDLIDPLIMKDFLLKQLQTQLNDLERYIGHLHAAIGRCPKPDSSTETCSCQTHGCSQHMLPFGSSQIISSTNNLVDSSNSLMNNESLPKTSRLIRSLVAQLICADAKMQEKSRFPIGAPSESSSSQDLSNANKETTNQGAVQSQQPQKPDDAVWSSHIDRVVLATDSLVNLFTLETGHQRGTDKGIDESFVESVVRRQLIPAIRDLLSYGLIEAGEVPKPSYVSLIFDPYQLISSLTCFPGTSRPQQPTSSKVNEESLNTEGEHVWNVIVDYYNSRIEHDFRSLSIKTLSQSFNLAPSMSGPIKVTSKQALLIAIDDIIETLAKCKPNGPESHLRTFIYTALNRSKLSVWLRLIFRNKSILRKYHQNHSFVNHQDRMEKFLKTLEALNQFKFNLRTDVESIEQFISAF